MSTVGAAHNVRVLGSGETTVVLGHGFGCDQSVWKHLVPHLVDQYRVLLYDNMGTGTTNPDHYDIDRYTTLEGHTSDLIAILEQFNVRKCIFIGHSLSALAAAMASLSRPEMFHKLIMVSTTPRLSNTGDYHGGTEQNDLDQMYDMMVSDWKLTLMGTVPLVIGGTDTDSVAMQEYRQMLFSIQPDILLSETRFLHRLDVRHLLPQVMLPCHIIQSSKDVVVPVAVAEYLHKNLGGKSIMEVMPTEGHLPHLSIPEITNPVLLRHIKQDIVDA